MTEEQKNAINKLLVASADAKDAAQAVNFAQAACNAANALRVIAETERLERSGS